MMQQMRGVFTGMLLAFTMILTGIWSCTKPELIGADLLDDEASQVGFTDTVSLLCTQSKEDKVLTYSSENGRQIVRSLVGHLNDPIFGKSHATAYSGIFLQTGSSAFLGRGLPDSVVISLRYDTAGIYGDPTQQVFISVYLLLEELDPEADLYSDYQPMSTTTDPIASKWVNPQPRDSFYIQSRGDSLRVPPMMRLQINSASFINNMLAQDSSVFESADSFRTWIKGIKIEMTQADNSMLGFDLRSAWSDMTIYYPNEPDTFSSEISFAFTDQLGSGVHHTHFVHEYENSEVQKFLDDPLLSDSLLFVQGMAGVNLGITLPGLPNIQDILINKAELEFYAAQLPGDNLNWYPPVPQLINAVENEKGDLEFSEDVNIIFNQFGFLDPFGGDLMESDSTGTAPKKYVLNVTASMQDIQKGRIDNQFFIIPFLKANVPNRVVLYGPGHPTYPARMRLTYTVVE